MVAALIIAAGKTSHKDKFEPLKEVGTITAIQRIVMVFQRAGVERIVVVCNHDDDDKTEKLAPYMNVIYLHGPKDAEMLDNVKSGLTYLQDKCTAAMIAHVDVPLFSVETVRALMAAEGSVCIPSYNGRAGHPLLVRAEKFQTILSYVGDGGLAGAIQGSDLKRHFVQVTDEGVLINTQSKECPLPEDHNPMDLYPDLRIRLVKERPFYGPGAHQLLLLTVETNSLREACRRMGISYTKGRKIIFTIEQQMGYSVLESRQGGKAGGHSVVTQEGNALMRSYTEFCAESIHCLQELFLKHFNP